MNRRRQEGGFFQDGFAAFLTLLGAFVLPAAPCVQKGRLQKTLSRKTHGARMYLVGVINKLSPLLCEKSAFAPSASSIVRVLKVWNMPRLTALFGQDQVGLLYCMTESPSQMGQDALALIPCGVGDSKYFVEAGACDGTFSSNTWILESRCEWNGLLAEPGRVWHPTLLEGRTCRIDTRALWRVSGENLALRQTDLPKLSTLEGCSDVDMHAMSRQGGTSYDVVSVSLQDYLQENGAPEYIDVLSLDTEGTEFEILRDFPFQDYSFGLIVCEHNNIQSFESIRDLLTAKGYTYLDELACISLGDAWFIGPRLQYRLEQSRGGRKLSASVTSESRVK